MSSARRDGQNHPFIWGPGQASIGRMTTPQTIQPSPAASTTNAPILMTREGELALREELARLREEVEVQLPKRLRQAREFGEASGNDDYLQILEENVSDDDLALVEQAVASCPKSAISIVDA